MALLKQKNTYPNNVEYFCEFARFYHSHSFPQVMWSNCQMTSLRAYVLSDYNRNSKKCVEGKFFLNFNKAGWDLISKKSQIKKCMREKYPKKNKISSCFIGNSRVSVSKDFSPNLKNKSVQPFCNFQLISPGTIYFQNWSYFLHIKFKNQ